MRTAREAASTELVCTRTTGATSGSAFIAAAARQGIKVLDNEPLAGHTTFRIGGPADLCAAATTIDQIEALVELAGRHELPVTILGGGSNVLVSDAGVRGLVILVRARGFSLKPATVSEPPRLIAESGMPLAGLARRAIREGLAGLEWAVSVPGTVGGAVIGNAGAHGSDIAANLAWATVYIPGVGRRDLSPGDMAYGYRTSALRLHSFGDQRGFARSPGPIVTSAAFDLVPGDAAELRARAETHVARRRASQPVEPCAGSIFRNPPGEFAGALIEAVGLKQHRIGGAQVSSMHANFIVNVGGASAADVAALMNAARRRVHEDAGVLLTPEILFLGNWEADPLDSL